MRTIAEGECTEAPARPRSRGIRKSFEDYLPIAIARLIQKVIEVSQPDQTPHPIQLALLGRASGSSFSGVSPPSRASPAAFGLSANDEDSLESPKEDEDEDHDDDEPGKEDDNKESYGS
ncbi:MAG: hypothetical protein LQ346_008795, partial [Caloplaca aetnensis]